MNRTHGFMVYIIYIHPLGKCIHQFRNIRRLRIYVMGKCQYISVYTYVYIHSSERKFERIYLVNPLRDIMNKINYIYIYNDRQKKRDIYTHVYTQSLFLM